MGRPVRDLTNQTFGRLTVLHRDLTKPSGAGKSAYWVCQCECGAECSIRTDKLTNGVTKSCGCLAKEVRSQIFLKDLSDQSFGKLKVIERDYSKPIGQGHFAYWKCKCECGGECSVRGDHLRNGTTQSCGCITSQGELKITTLLTEASIPFKREYTFSDLKVQELLRFDFAIFDEDENNLVCLIEYQGKQHFVPYNYDTPERFERRQQYDQIKREYCKEHNIPLIEIPYTDYDVLNLDYLLLAIKKEG